MKSNNINKWIFFGVLLLALPYKAAYAYIDPGSSSFIIQAIVAGVLAITLSTKNFWYKAKSFIKNQFFIHSQIDNTIADNGISNIVF